MESLTIDYEKFILPNGLEIVLYQIFTATEGNDLFW
jgi:hypothetical protein